MPEPTEQSQWAQPTENQPLDIHEAYKDGLKSDSEPDDMKMLVAPVKPVEAGDIVLIKRSGGAVEKWKLTNRLSKSGKQIAESLEPTLVNGVKEYGERPIDADDLTPEGQYSLFVQLEQQQEQVNRQALIREAQDEIEGLMTPSPVNLPLTHSAEAVPNYQPSNVEPVEATPSFVPDTVDGQARKRVIRTIHAQPINPPKKKWYEI